jgi:serine/threonine protein kinase
MLLHGEAVAQDRNEAMRYLKMSARKGYGPGVETYREHFGELPQPDDGDDAHKGVEKPASSGDAIMSFAEYERVRELGRGVCGVVDLMKHQGKNQYLAVKEVQPGPQFDSERILREVRVLCALDHPCILRIVGWSLPGREYRLARIATEFIKNGSVERALGCVRQGEPPAFWTHTNISIILAGLVLGLRYIHSKDIIHQSIKPSNLLIDDNIRVRIADFASARFEDCGTISTGVSGSYVYSTPEALEDVEERYVPTKNGDVFSFGLVLYEILVGESAFPKGNAMRIVKLHSEGWRPAIPAWIHPIVRTLIEQCWSKKPHERPSFDEIYAVLSSHSFPFYADVPNDVVKKYIAGIGEA